MRRRPQPQDAVPVRVSLEGEAQVTSVRVLGFDPASSERLVVTVPIRTVSEANAHEHWRHRQKRAKGQRATTARVILSAFGVGRLAGIASSVVTLTRIAPRALDGDNCVGAMKHCRDGAADAMGIKDNDPRVSWQYDQRRGGPKEYAVEIAIQVRA